MSDLIAGRITCKEDDPWGMLMASFGRAILSVRSSTERRLPYADARGQATELIVPRGSVIDFYPNFDAKHTYQELRVMAETTRHALLKITIGPSGGVTLFNDNTLQFRNPTPEDLRPTFMYAASQRQRRESAAAA